ncbi:MAG: DsbC family protein [Gammaproteobacteria bacterium]
MSLILASAVLTWLPCGQLGGAALADVTAETAIAGGLKAAFPDLEITRIAESSIPGLYEVMLGPDLVYVTADGRYLLDGDILDLREKLNISEERRATARIRVLAEIPADEMIEFTPAHPDHTVFVFTDISCGFCRRLHRDMPELNRLGIGVRYLAFPRAGLQTPTFRDMESVWCASDRRKALTEAKLGLPVRQASCDNPVKRHFALGQAIGVTGTPGIYTEDGRRLPGYLPPTEMLKVITRK